MGFLEEVEAYENPWPPWHVLHHRIRAMIGLECDEDCDEPAPPRPGGGLIRSLKAMYRVEDVAEVLTELSGLRERLKGKCPFHANGQERTPSFYVFTDQQRWYCFGCRKFGDVVDLIEYAEEMELPWHKARKRTADR